MLSHAYLHGMNIINVLHSKYAIKVILKCTSLGGVYDEHHHRQQRWTEMPLNQLKVATMKSGV